MAKIGGRFLSDELSSDGYRTDEFRGQRRRPWIVIRVGNYTLSQKIFIICIQKCRTFFIDNHGLLLDEPKEYLMFKQEYDENMLHMLPEELEDAMKLCKAKYEEGPMSIPIAIVVFDVYNEVNANRLNRIIEKFSDRINFIKLQAPDILEQYTDMDFSKLDEECRGLAMHIFEYENLPDSKAIKRPISPRIWGQGPRRFSERPEDRTCPEKQFKRPGYHVAWQDNQFISPISSQLETIGSRSYTEVNTNGLLDGPPPGLTSAPLIDLPPGLSLKPPPGLEEVPSSRSMHDFDNSDDSDEEELIVERVVENDPNDDNRAIDHSDVMFASRGLKLEAKRGLLSTNEDTVANMIAGKFLFNRFQQPFASAAHNLDLLYLLNHAVASTRVEVHRSIDKIVHFIFREDYFIKLSNRFLSPQGRWLIPAIELVFEVPRFFGYVCHLKPVRVGFMMESWESYLRAFKEINFDEFIEQGIMYTEVDALEELVTDINNFCDNRIKRQEEEERRASRNHPDDPTTSHQQPHHSQNMNEICFSDTSCDIEQGERRRSEEAHVAEQQPIVQEIWEKCEKIEPPSDFRNLSDMPTLADYHNPVEPYLRRIKDDGIYQSSQHYLDVQFRLLREDMISPLRDGISIYRNNGTHRLNRCGDILSSDIRLYYIEKLEGKEVSVMDGFEMRMGLLSVGTKKFLIKI